MNEDGYPPVEAALEKLVNLLPGDELKKGHRLIKETHIRDVQRFSGGCAFSPIAQHLRELGEEQVGLEEILQHMVKQKAITEDRFDEIIDATVDFHIAFDEMVLQDLKASCGCRSLRLE